MNGLPFSRSSSVRVAIIGGGFGGIAAAVKLRRAGMNDFTIFEKSAGPGGTWWDNRYPGCEVDIPSHAYSFSFLKHDWPRTHASQAELRAYGEFVVDHFDLRRHFRFETPVESVHWNETGNDYTVRTCQGDEDQYRAVICALGFLNVPNIPALQGIEDFRGEVMHTARWIPQDLSGKRVAIIGTGSTACQLAPAIADDVEELTVFQREPGWVMPKGERDFSPAERRRYRYVPGLQKWHRFQLFREQARNNRGFELGSSEQQRNRRFCEKYIARKIDDPDLRAAVTPTYPWGCKRPILASTFYDSLMKPNVHLVPHAVESASHEGVIDATGTKHAVDLIVFATGFLTTGYLAQIDVQGRAGLSIQEAWGGRPTGFLGITYPGFPNFFMIYGPNTNGGGSIIAQLERQAEFAVSAIKRLRRCSVLAVDTSRPAVDLYTTWIDGQIDKHASATQSGCHNYYFSGGKNVTQWPLSHFTYYFLTKLGRRVGLRSIRASTAGEHHSGGPS